MADPEDVGWLTADTWEKEAHRCKRVSMFNTGLGKACHNPHTLHRCDTTGDHYHYAEQVWHVKLGDEGGYDLYPILH